MSTAYKCDACEKLFTCVGSFSGDGAQLSGIGVTSSLKRAWCPIRVDICPECAKPLKEFLFEWWAEISKKNEG